MNNFEWVNAPTVEQAIALTINGSAIKAGGVDLLDLMKERLFEPKRLVNIRDIKELDYIKDDPKDGAKIGPLVTLAQLADDKAIRQRYTALADAAAHAATPQIRNMATLGGNLLQRPRCWYFRNELFHCRKKGGEKCYAQEGENQYHAIFDNGLCAIVHPSAAATPLIAMGAKIEITSAKEKREMLLEEFIQPPTADLHRENSLQPGEILTEIRIPTPAANSKSHYIKQGEKESFDWPIAEIAAVIERDGEACKRASIVLGAAAPMPHRAIEAEKMLAGQKIDEKLARQAARASLQAATPMTQNHYKLPLFENLITRAILEAYSREAKS
jgi:xanthine dehydrogenase YagS FAD-binding subunit